MPGHCNFHGNELADLEAKLGSEVAQPSVPLDSSTRAALIRREERQSSLTNPHLTALYTTRPREEEEALLRKADRNRPHPIPLRTPSPPPTLATYDRNVRDGQLPTLRGGRRGVLTSMAPMPCFHRGASTPRSGRTFDKLVRLPCASLALLRIIFRRLR